MPGIKEQAKISRLQISNHFIGAFVIGFSIVALIAYLLDASSIGYIASLSMFSFLATLLLTTKLLKNSTLSEAENTEISIGEIEANILKALQKYKIEAILQKGEEIIDYNNSAKESVTKENVKFENAEYVYLSEDNKRKLAIFPPPATINPNEGEEFVLRLGTACCIIDRSSKVKTKNDLFSKLFKEIKKDSKIKDILSKEDAQKLDSLINEAEAKDLAPATKFQVKDTQNFFLLSIDKITKSKESSFICQAVDISDFIYDESKQIQNQKMQAVGQLAGSIAHDFNNLLTAMIGFCDILLEQHGPTDQGFNEAMQIKQNANRAASLVKQLLAFSRKQVMNLSAINVNEIIVELASLLNRLLGEGVDLKIDCSRHIVDAMSDKNQLEQVIINLAVNARDAMDYKGKLVIKTYESEIDSNFNDKEYYAPTKFETINPGKYVVIEVTDTGSGIPNDIVNEIFEPFFSTKDPGSGTGLGLATVYGIVRQIGGYIRFKTEINKGTTFYIFLEATKEKKQTKAYRDKIEMNLIGDLYQKNSQDKKSKVLIVEDEEPVRMFEAHALRTRGFEVVDLEDPMKAIKYLEEEGDTIDIVITDVIMPGMTGPEMVEKVKDLYPHIKFLFTSGYTEEALSYFDENADHHFLSKPFSLEVLINMIDKILRKDD